ncbi:MAG: YidC/Oxa1 family membrane protein insertase [Clostridia bacterium]|nr:YidC/Oxa1 family membrane protein insertase [Clostridia bacterium]
MGGLFNIINIPLGYVMRFLADIFGGDFAAAVAVFTLLINVVLIPLSIKSQKSTVSQMRIKPKLDELKKRYGDDRQKMATEQQKLYQEEGVSMSGGCLPMIIRLLLMFSIYSLILSPLTYMASTGKSLADASVNKTDYIYTTITNDLSDKAIKKYDADKKAEYSQAKEELAKIGWQGKQKELEIINIIRKDPDAFEKALPADLYKKIEKDIDYIVEKDTETKINYNLFGVKSLDLTKTPDFSWNIFKDANMLWLIPIAAFLAQIITSLISMRVNKINNPDAPSMMGMMLTMPLISLFIGFGLPAGVGFYWICSSLIGGLIQSGVQLWYGPHKLLARERAKELGAQCDFEAKQIKKIDNNTDSIIKD